MLLSESKLLRALIIIWANDEIYGVSDDAETEYPTHDVRFVMTVCDDFLDDWIGGAWGRTDVWDRADEVRSSDWHIAEDVYFLTVEV
ncbi:hypothetical protein C8J57DRAFT_1506058 [Mycena rebaudengoi]|nr:hypothetical protein C8J57DRAFT_1506058 [Mycena rebaudengoi]